MRTIKFRGKRIDGQGWVYGGLITNQSNQCFIALWDSVYLIKGEADAVNSRIVPVLPDSVGQWTGLVDRHGKEIFEGDILHRDGHQNMFVEFYKGAFCLVSCDPVQRANWSPGTCRGSDIIYREIIGSIHDNPELMEVE